MDRREAENLGEQIIAKSIEIDALDATLEARRKNLTPEQLAELEEIENTIAESRRRRDEIEQSVNDSDEVKNIQSQICECQETLESLKSSLREYEKPLTITSGERLLRYDPTHKKHTGLPLKNLRQILSAKKAKKLWEDPLNYKSDPILEIKGGSNNSGQKTQKKRKCN